MTGKNVVTLNVIKKSGQNLLDASDKIQAIIAGDAEECSSFKPDYSGNRRSIAEHKKYRF